jgi:hypothetical protein
VPEKAAHVMRPADTRMRPPRRSRRWILLSSARARGGVVVMGQPARVPGATPPEGSGRRPQCGRRRAAGSAAGRAGHPQPTVPREREVLDRLARTDQPLDRDRDGVVRVHDRDARRARLGQAGRRQPGRGRGVGAAPRRLIAGRVTPAQQRRRHRHPPWRRRRRSTSTSRISSATAISIGRPTDADRVPPPTLG